MQGTSRKSGHELAIEINFYPSSKDRERIGALLPKKYTCTDLTCTQEDIDSFKRRRGITPQKIKAIVKRHEGLVRIEYSRKNYLMIKSNIGILIEEFLEGLNVLKPMLIKRKGKLRLGIFYDLNKTVIFPVILTAESIKQLAGFNLSFYSTGYPCGDKKDASLGGRNKSIRKSK